MADNELKVPIEVQSGRIDATLIPSSFSQAYMLHIIQQGTDIQNVAQKANSAASGAYDGQVKNEEQDKKIATNLQAIKDLTIQVGEQAITISANSKNIEALKLRVEGVEGDVANIKISLSNVTTDLTAIKSDYVSKSITKSQTLASPLNVQASLSVNDVKVVGPRQTGWTASTGTANKSAFNADLVFAVATTYTQSQIVAIAAGLIEARRRIKSLEDILRAHGLIDG